ncbi:MULTISPECIES: ABC transporter permease [Streptomyces]|uniref:ABC transporter permease n=1 Tax=Streptomyces TaxID=1883 RepID=UPI000A24DDF1|nr:MULTISPECIES: ABC transporter permease [Streptomyces]OSC74568.1 multidrug ABC transporter permease [Streptomyces sp. BF-3]WDT90707.1 ABC transporter permease [Streptomyces sp. SCSIO-PteL053]MCQ1581520.1 ABC transporter permease [Streptomyces parvus]PVC90048.1 multidrug ABC transporter permease [Streptomyces sp. CS131]UCA50579.1 ABC transporter permease [Streptomyces sp. WA6-1-16]
MLRDTGLIFTRDMRLALRSPTWLLIGIMQPLLYLFLFGPLMVTVVDNTPGFPSDDAWTVLTPALIVQTALFSGSFAGVGLLTEYRVGVVDRFRGTPASRSALLFGKVLAQAVQAVAQSTLIVVVTLLVFDLDAPLSGMLLSLAIAAVLAISLSSGSYALALILKSEAAFPSLMNMVLLPLLLLSGVLLPVTRELAPGWLYGLARINPLTHVVDAGRAAFRGDLSSTGLLTGCLVLVVMAALALVWGTRTFQKENA